MKSGGNACLRGALRALPAAKENSPKRGAGGRISEKNMQKHRAPRKNRRFFRGAPFENQIMVITIPCG